MGEEGQRGGERRFFEEIGFCTELSSPWRELVRISQSPSAGEDRKCQFRELFEQWILVPTMSWKKIPSF